MRIYLRDHLWTKQGRSDWARNLAGCFDIKSDAYGVSDPWEGNAICRVTREHESFKGERVVVFVHADSSEARKPWAAASVESLKGYVVFVSRPGQLRAEDAEKAMADLSPQQKWAIKPRVHACWWKMDDFLQGGQSGAQAFISKLRSGDADWIKWLQPTATNVDIALSILCQGYKAARGEFSSRVSLDKRQDVLMADWWLKPFGGIPKVEIMEALGSDKVPPEISELVNWMFDPRADQNLDELVKNALTKLPTS